MSQAMPHDYWDNLSDQGDRDGERDAARYYGLKGEEYAEHRFGLTLYETGHSDALVPFDHPASDRPTPLADTDTDRLPGGRRKVQIKGARLRVKCGDRGRPGRFRLWDTDHEQLVEDNALYLFLGYDPNFPTPVQYVRWIPARDLHDAVDDEINWYDAEHGTKDGRPTDLSVSRVFPDL